jgi:hypothetical protein
VKGQRIEIFEKLKNIFLIYNQYSLKSYQLGNIKKFSKKVFFRLNNFFFQEQKNFVQGTTFVQLFMYWKTKKKIRSDPKNLKKKLFLKIYLTDFEKKKIPKFFGSLRFFFCFPIHKKLNKSCFLDKIFLFLKKKVVSLKKTYFEKFSMFPSW